MIARSLASPRGGLLRPGDEVLTTDHEYGAMDRTWRFICRHTGARYVRQPIPLPVTTHEEFIDRFWSSVSAHAGDLHQPHHQPDGADLPRR